jgi:hypothetical protein
LTIPVHRPHARSAPRRAKNLLVNQRVPEDVIGNYYRSAMVRTLVTCRAGLRDGAHGMGADSRPGGGAVHPASKSPAQDPRVLVWSTQEHSRRRSPRVVCSRRLSHPVGPVLDSAYFCFRSLADWSGSPRPGPASATKQQRPAVLGRCKRMLGSQCSDWVRCGQPRWAEHLFTPTPVRRAWRRSRTSGVIARSNSNSSYLRRRTPARTAQAGRRSIGSRPIPGRRHCSTTSTAILVPDRAVRLARRLADGVRVSACARRALGGRARAPGSPRRRGCARRASHRCCEGGP